MKVRWVEWNLHINQVMSEARRSETLMEILNLLNLGNPTMDQNFQNDQELPAEPVQVKRR